MLSRVLKWSFIIGLTTIIILGLLLQFLDFTMSQTEMGSYFSEMGYKPQYKYVKTEEREIYYMIVGDSTKPNMVLVQEMNHFSHGLIQT